MHSAKTIEIKVALLRIGVKQADIARILGISRASVSDAINGRITSQKIMTYIESLIKQG